jgi:pyruvate kinase
MRAKIIATLGPATRGPEQLMRLAEAGASVFRLNFSHGTAADFAPVVEDIRSLEERLGRPLAILQDLSGPKIRTCDEGLGTIEIGRGQRIVLALPGTPSVAGLPRLCLDQPGILAELAPGDSVALSDGQLRFQVEERQGPGAVILTALSAGLAPPHKGVSFPGKHLSLPAVTAKDETDLEGGLALGVDVVAVSYVQRAEDIVRLRSVMERCGRVLPIVAKLERANAIGDLARIIEHSDALMVARGDLGLECPMAELPGLQKRVIRACNRAAKPVIVATQMLLSMVGGPMPTRAETTDVANAVLDGADCLMLSEETAIGRYPVEAVAAMAEIASRAEDYAFELAPGPRPPADEDHPARFLAYAACLLAGRSAAKALVVHTDSGASARIASSCRPRQPILALAADVSVRRFLNFSWGVSPHPVARNVADHLERAESFVEESGWFAAGERAVITAGQPKAGEHRTLTNVVKIYEK